MQCHHLGQPRVPPQPHCQCPHINLRLARLWVIWCIVLLRVALLPREVRTSHSTCTAAFRGTLAVADVPIAHVHTDGDQMSRVNLPLVKYWSAVHSEPFFTLYLRYYEIYGTFSRPASCTASISTPSEAILRPRGCLPTTAQAIKYYDISPRGPRGWRFAGYCHR